MSVFRWSGVRVMENEEIKYPENGLIVKRKKSKKSSDEDEYETKVKEEKSEEEYADYDTEEKEENEYYGEHLRATDY
jgi:hypothetical protein